MERPDTGREGNVFVVLLVISFVLFSLAASGISVNVFLRQQNLELAKYVQAKADEVGRNEHRASNIEHPTSK